MEASMRMRGRENGVRRIFSEENAPVPRLRDVRPLPLAFGGGFAAAQEEAVDG